MRGRRISETTSGIRAALLTPVPDERHIGDRRGRARFLKDPVHPRTGLHFRNPALRVAEITEHDRLRRARLLAGRFHLAVADGPASLLRPDFHLLYTLYAEGALFHDASLPHHDVGVGDEPLHVVSVGIVEPVEPSD